MVPILSRMVLVAASQAVFVACGFPKPADVPECTTATDCKSPASPFCVSGTCTAGCLDGTNCPTDKPVCDAEQHTCRGCDRDDECPGGVCLEADGRCALPGEVVFLRQSNSSDNAMCSAEMPCQSFAAALAATTPQRYVIHILGDTFHVTRGVDLTGRRLYIDGSDSTLFNDGGSADPVSTFASASAGPDITLGRMTIRAPSVSGAASVAVSSNGGMRLWSVTLGSRATVIGGGLDIANSTIPSAECSGGGTLSITGSNIGGISSTNCTLTALADRFNTAVVANLVAVSGGKVIIENSTFTSTEPSTDPLDIRNTVSGSRFAFNSVVNFSGADGTATPLFCDAGLDVSSSIFAWHSSATTPITGCVAHDSLFDEFAPANQLGSNRQASAATMFLDLSGKNLHLAPNSPARGLGQAGIVEVDIEGHPRPGPAGTRPDIGAYESP
jgi:hypothetical protein